MEFEPFEDFHTCDFAIEVKELLDEFELLCERKEGLVLRSQLTVV